MFTGRTLGVEEARAAGLVARIVAVEALADTLAEIGQTILAAPPASLAAAKRSIDRGLELDPRGALATELLEIEGILAGSDWRSRFAGFGDKS